jgi:hypothetical protein
MRRRVETYLAILFTVIKLHLSNTDAILLLQGIQSTMMYLAVMVGVLHRWQMTNAESQPLLPL